MKIAFLDRDGTIVKEYEEEGWIHRIEPEFLEGAIEGLKQLRQLGYQIIIITNQGLIHQGIITLEEYQEFNNNMIKTLEKHQIDILDIYYCPHTKEENCCCRKPKPGMILTALRKYEIDLNQCFVAGDTESDEGIAEYFDLPFFGINYSCHNKKHRKVQSLQEIVSFLSNINGIPQ